MKKKDKKGEEKKPSPEEIQKLVEALQPKIIIAGDHLQYGTPLGYKTELDFLDANIGLIPFGINDNELSHLEKISRAIEQGCNAKAEKSLEEIARQILEDETNLNLDNYNLRVSAGGARGAIATVINSVVTRKKSLVVYASPNWVFDSLVTNLTKAQPCNFHATTADEFTERFEKGANDNVASVILIDPANPLSYRFSREHIERIEQISEQYGIVPIFDDVFRGMQEKGGRYSSSEHSYNSVIVETSSKRFGARGIGATWTLIPKTAGFSPDISVGCQGCENIAATITQALYETGYGERIRQFITNNSKAFLKGFYSESKNMPGEFRQAFESMPIITYHLEPNQKFNSLTLRQFLREQVLITSGVDWICQTSSQDKERALHGISYARICPTKETPDRAYIAGKMVAEAVRTLAP